MMDKYVGLRCTWKQRSRGDVETLAKERVRWIENSDLLVSVPR